MLSNQCNDYVFNFNIIFILYGTTFFIQNAKYYFDYILIFHLSTRKIESIIIFNLFEFHAHRSIPEGLLGSAEFIFLFLGLEPRNMKKIKYWN